MQNDLGFFGEGSLNDPKNCLLHFSNVFEFLKDRGRAMVEGGGGRFNVYLGKQKIKFYSIA